MPIEFDIDYSDEIAALKKHAGYSALPARSGERHITLHYSAVDYPPTNQAGELQRILSEAKYQLNHDYGTPGHPAYPDGLLYDFVVLTDGMRVRTRARRQQLWHCGNQEGNARSWAIHVMTGKTVDATDAQWAGVTNLFDQLCVEYTIPHTSVVGHNEWPRTSGMPRPRTDYTLLPGQSECPGQLLHSRLAAWRAPATDPLRAATLPGVPGGPPIACSTGMAGFYQTRGGFDECGYPLRDEYIDVDMDCTILACERVILKSSTQYGLEQALLSEAKAQGWL